MWSASVGSSNHDCEWFSVWTVISGQVPDLLDDQLTAGYGPFPCPRDGAMLLTNTGRMRLIHFMLIYLEVRCRCYIKEMEMVCQSLLQTAMD